MYHSRFKGQHFEAGHKYGSKMKKYGISLDLDRKLDEARREYGLETIYIYQDYYPEIIEEIKGFAHGLGEDFMDVFAFLSSMYVYSYENHCSILALVNEEEIILGRNSDFDPSIEKLSDSCYYNLTSAYSFIGNTTAMIEMEDGVNEHGLACGMTFVYPTVRDYGFNAGFIVRYILEKCRSVDEGIDFIKRIPIASSQNIILLDKTGEMAVVESNPRKVIVTRNSKGESGLYRSNHFIEEDMREFVYEGLDEIYSHSRYDTLNRQDYSDYKLENVFELLSGKRGFLCQFDRSKGIDTIWSAVYDLKAKSIYRAEGNPSRKKFILDERMKFL